MRTEKSLLTENYNSWTEADRRSTRWLGAIVGAAGIFALDSVGILQSAIVGASRQLALALVAVVLVGVFVALFSAFKAESDADADLRYWLQTDKRAAKLASAVARNQLLALTLPYETYGRVLEIESPASIADLNGLNDTKEQDEATIQAGLSDLLKVQSKLRFAATQAADSDKAKLQRATDRVESAVEELHARANFQSTRKRMTTSRRGIALGAAISLGGLFGFIVSPAATNEVMNDSQAEASNSSQGITSPVPVHLHAGPSDTKTIERARALDASNAMPECTLTGGTSVDAWLVDGSWTEPIVLVPGRRADADGGVICRPVMLSVIDSASIVEPRG
jgi:hypothetical protein